MGGGGGEGSAPSGRVFAPFWSGIGYGFRGNYGSVCRQDKTRQDNVLFGVLNSPIYIDFNQ